MLTKQPSAAEKWRSSSLGLDSELTIPNRKKKKKKKTFTETLHKVSSLEISFVATYAMRN